MTWFGFGGVIVAFFVTHAIPTRPRVRRWLVARLTQRGFTIAYSLLSLVMLAALIGAAGAAPYVHLWGLTPAIYYLVLAGMGAVCMLLALSVGRPNPFSFGGVQNERFDPEAPGIIRWIRHPILVALGAWAALHTLANGDLAHVLLFAPLAVFAFAGQGLVDRKAKARMGIENWRDMRKAMQAYGPWPAPAHWSYGVLRLAAGCALYAGLVAAHPWIAGVTLH